MVKIEYIVKFIFVSLRGLPGSVENVIQEVLYTNKKEALKDYNRLKRFISQQKRKNGVVVSISDEEWDWGLGLCVGEIDGLYKVTKTEEKIK